MDAQFSQLIGLTCLAGVMGWLLLAFAVYVSDRWLG